MHSRAQNGIDSSKSTSSSAHDVAATQKSLLTSAVIVDRAAAKKARKLERRRLRAELGIQPGDQQHQQQHQQQQVVLSEEERAHRKAAKRLRQALARAEAPHIRSSRAGDASAVGFHSHMTPAVACSHPFAVSDERDHAETPFEAYRDIADVLHQLALHLGKSHASLRIYDPYYCEGSVLLHLRALGFSNVYNRNEDFYARIEDGSVPDFDVLVTNPPFSSNHMARALKFAWDCGRAWLLLLPDFVSRKTYYKELSQSAPAAAAPWFIGPRHSLYTFAAPRKGHTGSSLVDANIRHVSSHGASVFAAPFQCVWFLHLADAGRAIRARIDNRPLELRSYVTADSVDQLPQLAKPAEKPHRPWRKKAQRERKRMRQDK